MYSNVSSGQSFSGTTPPNAQYAPPTSGQLAAPAVPQGYPDIFAYDQDVQSASASALDQQGQFMPNPRSSAVSAPPPPTARSYAGKMVAVVSALLLFGGAAIALVAWHQHRKHAPKLIAKKR